MSEKPSEAEIKVTIAKFFRIAYSKNKGVATALVQKRGAFTLIIDDIGNVTLSGNAGMEKFSGEPVLKEVGLDSVYGGVMFSNVGNNRIKYTVKLKSGAADISFSNIIDVEKLLLGCSGLLCQDARVLKNRTQQIDEAVEGAFR